MRIMIIIIGNIENLKIYPCVCVMAREVHISEEEYGSKQLFSEFERQNKLGIRANLHLAYAIDLALSAAERATHKSGSDTRSGLSGEFLIKFMAK